MKEQKRTAAASVPAVEAAASAAASQQASPAAANKTCVPAAANAAYAPAGANAAAAAVAEVGGAKGMLAAEAAKGAPVGSAFAEANAAAAAAVAKGAPAKKGAGQETPADRRHGRAYFTASRIAKIALLSALAYVVTFLEFPVFPAVSFLKLDFANVFILLGGFMYGPVAAVVISAVKELLSLIDTQTIGVGEVANSLLTLSFVLVPTIVYRFKKGLPTVTLTLAAGCVLQIAASLVVNRYINFPLYEAFLPFSAAEAFAQWWWYIILFNLIKCAAVSLITLLLYKRISWLLNKF